MKRSDKKNLVQNLKDELDSSTSVIVTHYPGLTVNESEELRSEMRDNGAKFKVTKNRLTKLALEQTQFKDLADLLQMAHKMRMDEIKAQTEFTKAESSNIKSQTNVQINESVPFGQGNYGSLMEKLLNGIEQ